MIHIMAIYITEHEKKIGRREKGIEWVNTPQAAHSSAPAGESRRLVDWSITYFLFALSAPHDKQTKVSYEVQFLIKYEILCFIVVVVLASTNGCSQPFRLYRFTTLVAVSRPSVVCISK